MDKRDNEKATLEYAFYLQDDSFKEAYNVRKYIEEAQNFYNGIQYPEHNEDNMIRVTMNFCSFSSNIKASKIVGTKRYITFTADNTQYDCRRLQRFDEYNVSKLNEETEDFQTCLNGFNDGTGIDYYRWDEDDTTYKGIYKGGLAIEHIDILRFAVANPFLQEIQNQKWVMFWSDYELEAVKEMIERSSEAEKEKVQKELEAKVIDDEKQAYVGHRLVTVFTRFFRIEGEVCFMCSTRGTYLFEYPHFLNPKVDKKVKQHAKEIVDKYDPEDDTSGSKIVDWDIDYEDMATQVVKHEMESDEDYKKTKEKFYLYPFAKFSPYKINGFFYGRSDVKDLIPIQKGVNFALSMMLKCIENNAYNKIIVKDGALQGQEITNEAGQVITDYSRMTNQWGIKFAESQPMPNGVIDFISNFFQMTRVVYGFNDVMDGSVSNQDISGYAVQQMIKQANSSIEQQQQLFWKFCKDKASIRLMFYKFYVDKAKYTYELEDYEVTDKENKRKLLQRAKDMGQQLEIEKDGQLDLSQPTNKTQIRDFSGKEIFGTSFDINIEVIQGLADSKLAESEMWNNLIMNGNIQNLEPEMLELYLEANPTVAGRTKATLKNIVERQKMSENYQLKQKLQEAIGIIDKLRQYSVELEAQNGYRKNYIDALTKEFTDKLNVANKVITAQNDKLSQSGESQGEVKSNNARGVKGSKLGQQED